MFVGGNRWGFDSEGGDRWGIDSESGAQLTRAGGEIDSEGGAQMRAGVEIARVCTIHSLATLLSLSFEFGYLGD